MIELKKPSAEEQSMFNFKVKSLSLRKEFELGNLFFNARKGIVLAEKFTEVEDSPDAQRKQRIILKELLTIEGFVDCGDIYGYNKI